MYKKKKNYQDDDMTYAVVVYAEEHPAGKLQWKAIVEWIHKQETQDKYTRLNFLLGIRDYQFYRKVKRKNDKGGVISTYRECKIRFDQINELREYISKTQLPDIVSVTPEKFLALTYSQQRSAIIQLQENYMELQERLGEAEAKAQHGRVQLEYIHKIERRIEDVDNAVKKVMEKYSRQLNHIIRCLNETEMRKEMQQFGITAEGIDRNRIMDFLEDQQRKLYSIKNDLNAYKLLEYKAYGNNEGKGEKGALEIVEGKKNGLAWNEFNAALFDDDEEIDDDE